MNYGKLAFIKATEIEKELLSKNQTTTNMGFDCFSVSTNTPFTVSVSTSEVAYITPTNPSKVCVFAKFKVSASSQTSMTISLVYNGTTFASTAKTITSQEEEMTILSVASMAFNESGALSVSFNSSQTVTISSYNIVVMGASSGEKADEIDLKACEYNGKICLAYLKNGMIYYQTNYIEDFSLDVGSFQSFKQAQAFDCCFNPASPDYLYFANTDSQNKLYISTNENNNSVFIDSDVSAVTLGLFYENNQVNLLIAYIKNKKIYYRTLVSGVLSDKTPFSLPDVDFVSISFLKGEYDDCYLIATDIGSNNYFLKSVKPMQASALAENLFIATSFSFTAILYALKGDEDNAKEHLYSSFVMLAYLTGQIANNIACRELFSIEVGLDFSFETFVIPQDAILYGVDYDMTSDDADKGITNAVYTNDAIGLNYSYVYMASSSSTPEYRDNGWSNRWPYNQIRPCVIKNDIVTYVTDDFSQTIEDTPRNIDLNLNVGGGANDFGDFFVEIPKFYYRYSMRDGHILEFRLSSCKRAGFCCFGHTYMGEEYDKVYVGAFPTAYLSSEPRSIPNQDKWQLSNQPTSSLRNVCVELGNGQDMINLNVLNMLEMLFIIQCKSLDYKESIGYGYCYNSVSLSLKTTGTSLSYPSRTYGFLKSNQKKVERFNYIEGFCSFADFALAGTNINQGRIGFYNVEGKTNNWVDDTNSVDYMFFDIDFPSSSKTTKKYLVANKVGLLPIEFYDSNNAAKFDLFRSRFNSFSNSYTYRMHFPNLGTSNMGLFSYNFPLTSYNAGVQGHRRIYYKPKEEINAG